MKSLINLAAVLVLMLLAGCAKDVVSSSSEPAVRQPAPEASAPTETESTEKDLPDYRYEDPIKPGGGN